MALMTLSYPRHLLYRQWSPPLTLAKFMFQNAIAMHESNGIDIIIALLLNDINPLGKHRMDLVLELKVGVALPHQYQRKLYGDNRDTCYSLMHRVLENQTEVFKENCK